MINTLAGDSLNKADTICAAHASVLPQRRPHAKTLSRAALSKKALCPACGCQTLANALSIPFT